MSDRFSIKIGGASGTGINTVGLILSRALKRTGFHTVAYREYPSLIKGGFASYKIDFSDKPISAISKSTNIYLAIDKPSFQELFTECSKGEILIYDQNIIRVGDEETTDLEKRGVEVYPLPFTFTAKETCGNTIMKNAVMMGVVWKILGLDKEVLLKAILDIFNKTKEIEEGNKNCALAGMDLVETKNLVKDYAVNDVVKNHLSISGNEAIALGAIAGGVRAYIAYPMTPSSSILHTISKFAKETGIFVKQAEDEITAVNMTLGANHAGTRAMCATSGGGFDLMSESLSLAGITETPLVVCVAQRPGPGTGVPTWTCQGDLRIAINAGHGEFPRIILAPGDVQECFDMTVEALNLSEKYQTLVILLTDKYLAESLFMNKPFETKGLKIDRGELITKDFDKTQERYAYTETGVSPRWLPGEDANTYLSNSDEHNEHGFSTEDAVDIEKMINKRMSKTKAILSSLPEPEIFGEKDAEISIIGWGSTKDTILDAMAIAQENSVSVNFLYFKYVYPLKTEVLSQFINDAKSLVVIENNEVGQLADLIQQTLGTKLENRLLKYDGRPFFVEEISNYLNNYKQ